MPHEIDTPVDENGVSTTATKHKPRLTDEQITAIRAMRAEDNGFNKPKNSHVKVANEFGITAGVVSHICRNNTYHNPEYTPVFDGPNLTTVNGKTEEELAEINAAKEAAAAEKIAAKEAREAEKAEKAAAREAAKVAKAEAKTAKAEAREEAKAAKAAEKEAKAAERQAAKEAKAAEAQAKADELAANDAASKAALDEEAAA